MFDTVSTGLLHVQWRIMSTENEIGHTKPKMAVNGERWDQDRGWAWVIVLAGIIVVFLGAGVYRCLGLLLVEAMDVYDASTAEASIIFSCLGIGMFSAALLFTFGIGDIVQERALVTASGLLISLGFVVTYFSRTIQEIYVLGFCTGMAMQMGQTCSSSMVGKYFKKRLSAAMGMMISGISLATLVLPPFVQWLFDNYTYRGAALILAGMALNTVVAATLMRPVNVEKKLSVTTKHETETEVHVAESVPESSQPNTLLDLSKTNSDQVKNLTSQSSPCNKMKRQNMTEDKLSLCKTFLRLVQTFAIKQSKDGVRNISIRETLVLSVNFFKDPTFVFFQFFVYFTTVGCECLIQFYPAFTHELGLSDYQSAFLLSIVGASGLMGRLLFGVLGDCNLMARYRLVMIPQVFLGTACFLSRFATVFWSQVIFAVAVGSLYGTSFSFRTVLLVDFFGIPTLMRRMGVTYIITGIGFATGGPILGSIRDATGDFRIPLQIVGIFFYSGALSLLAIGIHIWYRRRKQQGSEDNNVQA